MRQLKGWEGNASHPFLLGATLLPKTRSQYSLDKLIHFFVQFQKVSIILEIEESLMAKNLVECDQAFVQQIFVHPARQATAFVISCFDLSPVCKV